MVRSQHMLYLIRCTTQNQFAEFSGTQVTIYDFEKIRKKELDVSEKHGTKD